MANRAHPRGPAYHTVQVASPANTIAAIHTTAYSRAAALECAMPRRPPGDPRRRKPRLHIAPAVQPVRLARLSCHLRILSTPTHFYTTCIVLMPQQKSHHLLQQMRTTTCRHLATPAAASALTGSKVEVKARDEIQQATEAQHNRRRLCLANRLRHTRTTLSLRHSLSLIQYQAAS